VPDLCRIAPFVVAAVVLAACAPRSGPPAPVSHGGESRPALSRSEAASGVVVVQQGDTLYAVARRIGAPVRALIDANRLQAPYRIQAGQRLQIPAVAAARPAPTTAPIAAGAGPSAPTVVAVPRGSVEAAPLTPPPPATSASAADPAVAPSASAVVMPPPPAPGGEVAETGATTPTEAVSAPASRSGASAAAPTAETVRPPPPQATEAATPARAGRFLWPLRGNIVSTFGQKPGGLQNDGINIAAPRGTPVRATENGVVVYAGNELKGFGNLLLLRHADGWMSAYAHLDDIVVERGASVGRGQVIAKVGQTGSVATPQLHFELRMGGRAVDPRGQLAPLQTAEAN
jgi:murein DD-endopeptidase MepM/ murein hydrolase activator NlpD